MTQLDLFSLSAVPAMSQEKMPTPTAMQSKTSEENQGHNTTEPYTPGNTGNRSPQDHTHKINSAVENIDDNPGQELPPDSIVPLNALEKAIIKNLERKMPEVALPLTNILPAENERNGEIVFEDHKITVKIKNRPATLADGDTPPKKPEPRRSIVTRQPPTEFSLALNNKLNELKNSIKQGLINDAAEKKKKEKKPPQKRGRKSFKDINNEVDLINIPDDEALFSKQYYSIREVAGWFNVNTSLLRFWENEFDILKPRKNRKGDRLFRPEDVKNLQLIYQLIRQHKYSLEGAREYLKNNKGKADVQVQLTTTLQKFRSFLLEIKANLE